MMLRRWALAVAVLLPVAAWAQSAEPTGPQPELPKQAITIITNGGVKHTLDVEVASTPEQQTTGEMFRKSVPADGGMLFDWHGVQDSDMWMKNTLAPLDMIFIGQNMTVTHIAEDAVPQSLRIISSGGPVRATLEVAAGTAKRLGIDVGDKVEMPLLNGAQ